MSLEYYEQETESDKSVAKRIKNEVGALRAKHAREIQSELRRKPPKANPLASPKIYKHSRQYYMTQYTGAIPERVRNHPFVDAATHMWKQLELCFTWYVIYPNHIHGWMRHHIVPCERDYELGDITPGLHKRMMELDVESFILDLTKKKKYRVRHLTPRAGRCIVTRNPRIIQ